jgi:hypothetical protein
LALVTPSVWAQTSTPAGWEWTLDAAAQHVAATDSVPTATFGFVTMAPGWHVTMGPGALLYHPRSNIDGRFALESRIVLFPGTSAAEYGVFVGGRELGDSSRSWVAFVVRRDGSAAVLRHTGGRTEALVPWTRYGGVKPGGPETVANVLRVVLDTAVAFRVNDSTIATLSRLQVPTTGTFGFRIGKDLNLHITTLDVTHRLAPAR